MFRRAFTLIELLVIIAIMGAMVTVGVVSINGSASATRVAACTRDVMAMIRRARSTALVTQKPVVLIYKNDTVDGEAFVLVEMQAEKLFSSRKSRPAVMSLEGEIVVEAYQEEEGAAGETLEEVMSPDKISDEVTQGLKIRFLEADEELLLNTEVKHSQISVFSTADNISRTFNNTTSKNDATEAPAEDKIEHKVAFAVNGTVNPAHKIWIYREGSSPDKGMCIAVDRFGEPRCLGEDEK